MATLSWSLTLTIEAGHTSSRQDRRTTANEPKRSVTFERKWVWAVRWQETEVLPKPKQMSFRPTGWSGRFSCTPQQWLHKMAVTTRFGYTNSFFDRFYIAFFKFAPSGHLYFCNLLVMVYYVAAQTSFDRQRPNAQTSFDQQQWHTNFLNEFDWQRRRLVFRWRLHARFVFRHIEASVSGALWFQKILCVPCYSFLDWHGASTHQPRLAALVDLLDSLRRQRQRVDGIGVGFVSAVVSAAHRTAHGTSRETVDEGAGALDLSWRSSALCLRKESAEGILRTRENGYFPMRKSRVRLFGSAGCTPNERVLSFLRTYPLDGHWSLKKCQSREKYLRAHRVVKAMSCEAVLCRFSREFHTESSRKDCFASLETAEKWPLEEKIVWRTIHCRCEILHD